MRGGHARRKAGQGEAFWRFRPHLPGDARRDVDWKQTARRGALFVKEREKETPQDLWLWRDASPSMAFSSSRRLPPKRERAEVLLLALSLLAGEAGERVALLGGVEPPSRAPDAAEHLARALEGEAVLQERISVAAQAQVVIFSDFFFPLASLSGFCGALSKRPARGLLVQICDPAEEALPSVGAARLIDPEAPDAPFDVGDVRALRDVYAARFAAHRAALFDAARGWGWRAVAISTAATAHDNLAAIAQSLEAPR